MTMVSGRVVGPTGEGAAGVYVYAVPAGGRVRFGRAPGTHSDLTGRWALDLPAGQWTVRETSHASYDIHVAGQAINVAAGAIAVTPAKVFTPTRRRIEKRRDRRREARTPTQES